MGFGRGWEKGLGIWGLGKSCGQGRHDYRLPDAGEVHGYVRFVRKVFQASLGLIPNGVLVGGFGVWVIWVEALCSGFRNLSAEADDDQMITSVLSINEI